MRPTRYIEHNGETLNLKEWAAKLGIPQGTLKTRLRKWGTERALSTGKLNIKKTYTHQGKTRTLKQWAKVLGVRYDFLYSRLRHGMTIDEAFDVAEKRGFEYVDGLADVCHARKNVMEDIKAGWTPDFKAKLEAIKKRKAGQAA
jgi:hypothetical protein